METASGQPEATETTRWLCRLSEVARCWIGRSGRIRDIPPSNATASYADLMFAFGLARLGDQRSCEDLQQRASAALRNGDEIHETLLCAFEYRISEASKRRPHAGPLPEDIRNRIEGMGAVPAYAVNRLRQRSRILEPDERIDPYSRWVTNSPTATPSERAELRELKDSEQLAAKARRLLANTSPAGRGAEERFEIVWTVLDNGVRASRAFSEEMLVMAPRVYDALRAHRKRRRGWPDRAVPFLMQALAVAVYHDLPDSIPPIRERFQRVLRKHAGRGLDEKIEGQAILQLRHLRRLGFKDEAERYVVRVVELALGEGESRFLALRKVLGQVARSDDLCEMLKDVGDAARAVEPARALLFLNELRIQEQAELTCAYVNAMPQCSPLRIRDRLEELFQRLDGIHDNYFTASHYFFKDLEIIEAVIAVVTGPLTTGPCIVVAS